MYYPRALSVYLKIDNLFRKNPRKFKWPVLQCKRAILLKEALPPILPATAGSVVIRTPYAVYRNGVMPLPALEVWIGVVDIGQCGCGRDLYLPRLFTPDFLARAVACHLGHTLVASTARQSDTQGNEGGKTNKTGHDNLLVKWAGSPDCSFCSESLLCNSI